MEGPELVLRDDTYYLFFASGRFCQDSYKEGIARSNNVWGPYEKLAVPILSNGIVGVGTLSNQADTKSHQLDASTSDYAQLVGPGHASILKAESQESENWKIAYHASVGETCNRVTFVDRLVWGSDGWPFVDMGVDV